MEIAASNFGGGTMYVNTLRQQNTYAKNWGVRVTASVIATSACPTALQRVGSANCLAWLGLLLLVVASRVCTAAGYFTYQYDPVFNGGFPLEDRFANVDTNDYVAQRLARAANGDLVVAGIVPAAYQSGAGNIGLVRYTGSGQRTAWSNPTAAYASYFNIYLTFPNSTGATYTRVVDLKIQNGFIYALVDYKAGSESDVYLVVFRDDGTYIGEYASFTTGLDEHGAGLVPYSFTDKFSNPQRRLIAVATYKNGSGNRVITLKRFTPALDGTLTVDTGFGPYANGANDILIPSDACDAGARCDAEAEAVTAVATTSVFPRLYIAASAGTGYDGTYTYDTDVVVGIDGSNGGLLAGFGSQTSGIYYTGFLRGSSGALFAGQGPLLISATTTGTIGADIIYLVDSSTFCAFLSCSGSASLMKLRAQSGLPPPSNGTVPDFLWGNGGEVNIFDPYSGAGMLIEAVSADSQRLMAVGGVSSLCGDAQGSLYFCGSGYSTSLSAVNGGVEGLSLLPGTRSGGSDWATQSWTDIVPGPVPGTFNTTGPMGSAPPSILSQFGTSQILLSEEGIFRNGFQ